MRSSEERIRATAQQLMIVEEGYMEEDVTSTYSRYT